MQILEKDIKHRQDASSAFSNLEGMNEWNDFTLEEITRAIKQNWKSPGLDKLHNFWINKVNNNSCHGEWILQKHSERHTAPTRLVNNDYFWLTFFLKDRTPKTQGNTDQ